MRGVLAVRFHQWKSAPVVEEAPDPRPKGGESLVEIEAAALTHLDLTIAGGEFPILPSLPYVGGSEGAGRVLESERFEPGERVRIHGGGVGVARDGTWAERAAIPNEALGPIPSDTDMALAASFASPSLSAEAAVHEIGQVAPGERVAVTGAAGCVGAMAAQLARRAGASAVLAIASTPERAALVLDQTEVVALSDPHASDRIRGEQGVDLLIDTVGGPSLPSLLTSVIRPGGRAVLVGYAAGTTLALELPALMAADVRLLPLNMMNRLAALEPRCDQLLEQLRAGELRMPMTRVTLDQLPSSYERLLAGAAEGRIVAELGSPGEGDRNGTPGRAQAPLSDS